jgi:hypothetical protein
MDIMEIGLESTDLIHVAQDRDRWRTLVNTVMNLRIPQKSGNFWTNLSLCVLNGRLCMLYIAPKLLNNERAVFEKINSVNLKLI